MRIDLGRVGVDMNDRVARIKSSPFIPKTDKVRGFVYEVDRGRLRPVNP